MLGKMQIGRRWMWWLARTPHRARHSGLGKTPVAFPKSLGKIIEVDSHPDLVLYPSDSERSLVFGLSYFTHALPFVNARVRVAPTDPSVSRTTQKAPPSERKGYSIHWPNA